MRLSRRRSGLVRLLGSTVKVALPSEAIAVGRRPFLIEPESSRGMANSDRCSPRDATRHDGRRTRSRVARSGTGRESASPLPVTRCATGVATSRCRRLLGDGATAMPIGSDHAAMTIAPNRPGALTSGWPEAWQTSSATPCESNSAASDVDRSPLDPRIIPAMQSFVRPWPDACVHRHCYSAAGAPAPDSYGGSF